MLSFALFSNEAGACKRCQIDSCRDRRPLLILRTDCWAAEAGTFLILSRQLVSALIFTTRLLPSFSLCCPCSISQNRGRVKPVQTGGLSPPGKLQQDHKRLCIRCCIASVTWVLLYSSLLFHCHETDRYLQSLSEDQYLLFHP